MTRLLAPIVFLLSLPLSADEPAPTPLRVLCYNIHFGQGMDGNYDLERLAKVIQNLDPDLVALQEVDVGVERSHRVHQARKLAELTGLQVRYGPTQHYQGGLYGNAVLTKLPILDVHIQPLPYTEATEQLQTYPRGAIAVTVQAPDGKPLRFISTHFQHNVPEDRLAEAKALNEFFAEKDDARTILAGDFNATPDSSPIAELLTQWHSGNDDAFEPSAPSQNPKNRIDYIFFRPARAFHVLSSRVIAETMASDHRPVFSELRLQP